MSSKELFKNMRKKLFLLKIKLTFSNKSDDFVVSLTKQQNDSKYILAVTVNGKCTLNFDFKKISSLLFIKD